jgi:spore photoproduct lyase
VTGCPGKCEYCYLNNQLGKKPYIRVYVNIDEILDRTKKYIDERKPGITLFEASATSDPLPVEEYTGSLKRTINFFGKQEFGRLRFVTKFTDVESILDAEHNGNTTVRFSINAGDIIQKYEHGTPGMAERIGAAQRIAGAGYNLGFIIAPVFMYENYKEDYKEMIEKLSTGLKDYKEKPIHFEVISHRYTLRAKKTILDIFPNTCLPMEESNRKFKFGQFGYGKYVYDIKLNGYAPVFQVRD